MTTERKAPFGCSETSKYRQFTRKYCINENGEPGVGIDIASNGDPVVPWAFNFDLPEAEFAHYNSGYMPRGPVQLSGFANRLPVNNDCLDFVYSSHLLEDYTDWEPILKEWVRPLKPGGRLIILMPDRERWVAACAAGQPPNDAHRHETNGPEEIGGYAERIGCELLESRFTDIQPGDYTVLAVFLKKASP